jgi:bacteriocin-like protein
MENKNTLRELSETELDSVTGGAISEVLLEVQNPAGQTPPGQQGDTNVPNDQFTPFNENHNPAGQAPPGQNA